MISVVAIKNSLKLIQAMAILVGAASGAWAQNIATPATNHQAEAVDTRPVERRVMFDEAITWATSKHAADQILDRLKVAGFNVYVP